MNILLADNQTLYRDGVKYLLKNGFSHPFSIKECSSIVGAEAALKSEDFRLILLNPNLDDSGGVDSLLNIQRSCGNCPIVIMSAEDDMEIKNQCLSHGAIGFLSKRCSHREILDTVSEALDTGVGGQPLASAQSYPASESSTLLAGLSKRQREVLLLLLRGTSNKSISHHMDISQNTVKAHLSAIFKVLGVRNRTEAVYIAAREGMPLD